MNQPGNPLSPETVATIKRLLGERALTQRQIAKQTGTSHCTVGNIARGTYKPPKVWRKPPPSVVESGASCDQCGKKASRAYPLFRCADGWLRCPECAGKFAGRRKRRKG